jgi:Icc-related predicted phosphoesterase
MMKLVLISDTHNLHNDLVLPEGDTLVHAGDWTMAGNRSETTAACSWLRSQTKNFKHVVAIAGNHDWFAYHCMREGHEGMLRNELLEGVHYLRDNEVVLDGVKFYGSPWQPWFYDWAFNAHRGEEIRKHWDAIPTDTDVLITHGPPKYTLDYAGKERVGCEELRSAVQRIKPPIHVFGHIHAGHGYKLDNGTEYFNAAVVDEAYKLRNKPWVTEV